MKKGFELLDIRFIRQPSSAEVGFPAASQTDFDFIRVSPMGVGPQRAASAGCFKIPRKPWPARSRVRAPAGLLFFLPPFCFHPRVFLRGQTRGRSRAWQLSRGQPARCEVVLSRCRIAQWASGLSQPFRVLQHVCGS